MPQIPYRARIALIHAGIDEISPIIKHQYPNAQLLKYNIFDTQRHKESEERKIRSKYALPNDTVSISTSFLPLAPHSVDAIFLILSTGELKDDKERVYFFQQMQEALKPGGQLIFVEHMQNLPNLLAYTWGAFEFLK